MNDRKRYRTMSLYIPPPKNMDTEEWDSQVIKTIYLRMGEILNNQILQPVAGADATQFQQAILHRNKQMLQSVVKESKRLVSILKELKYNRFPLTANKLSAETTKASIEDNLINSAQDTIVDLEEHFLCVANGLGKDSEHKHRPIITEAQHDSAASADIERRDPGGDGSNCRWGGNQDDRADAREIPHPQTKT